MLTKRQVKMVQLALARKGTPVSSRKWISDGFDDQWPDRSVYALYYNIGRDTKVMVWEK